MMCKHYDAPTKAPYVNDGTTCSNKCSAAYSTRPPISIMQSVLSGTFACMDSNEVVVPNLKSLTIEEASKLLEEKDYATITSQTKQVLNILQTIKR